jgi:hypothetical protein
LLEQFDTGARHLIVHAAREAREFGHSYVGPEHLLIGAALVVDGPVAVVLDEYDIKADAVRAVVRQVAGGHPSLPPHADIPFTDATVATFAAALAESKATGQRNIGVRQLLLAVTLARRGQTEQVLNRIGVDLTRMRTQLEWQRVAGEFDDAGTPIPAVTLVSAPATAPPRQAHLVQDQASARLTATTNRRRLGYRAITAKFAGPAAWAAVSVSTAKQPLHGVAPFSPALVIGMSAAYLLWVLIPQLVGAVVGTRRVFREWLAPDRWIIWLCAVGTIAIVAQCIAVVRADVWIGGAATVIAGCLAGVMSFRMYRTSDRFGGTAALVLAASLITCGGYLTTDPKNLGFLPLTALVATLCLIRISSVKAFLRFVLGGLFLCLSVLFFDLGRIPEGVSAFGGGVLLVSLVGFATTRSTLPQVVYSTTCAVGAGIGVTGMFWAGRPLAAMAFLAVAVGFAFVSADRLRRASRVS